jgi:hypothetical protein
MTGSRESVYEVDPIGVAIASLVMLRAGDGCRVRARWVRGCAQWVIAPVKSAGCNDNLRVRVVSQDPS